MGKVAKKAVGGFVDAVKGAPKTIAKTALDTGKSLVGANGGNYFKDLGESALNAGVVSATGGLTGTKDLGGTNNIDTQGANLMGKGPDAPALPDAPVMNPAEDAALKAELENSQKKGRASTILAGGSDNVGSTSAKKTLLGSL